MQEFIQVVTTISSQADARRIADALVQQRLAGCVQIVGPIESLYRWEGKIETATEWQCWIKTRKSHYKAVEQAIHKLHPYEVPEILAVAGAQRQRKIPEVVGGFHFSSERCSPCFPFTRRCMSARRK